MFFKIAINAVEVFKDYPIPHCLLTMSLFPLTNENISSCTTDVIEPKLSHPVLLWTLRWGCRQTYCYPCLGEGRPLCPGSRPLSKEGVPSPSALPLMDYNTKAQVSGSFFPLKICIDFVPQGNLLGGCPGSPQSWPGQTAVLRVVGEGPKQGLCRLLGCFCTSLAAGTIWWTVPSSVQDSPPYFFSLTDWDTWGFMRDFILAVEKASSIT